ncbi:rnf217, partial [Symbiodinium pilosum]
NRLPTACLQHPSAGSCIWERGETVSDAGLHHEEGVSRCRLCEGLMPALWKGS